MLVDFAIICGSFLAAYLLFVGGNGTRYQRAVFLRALPVLLGARYVAFVVFGIYRRIWRFAGARDAARDRRGGRRSRSRRARRSSCSTQEIGDFPLEIFVVDALLCTLLVALRGSCCAALRVCSRATRQRAASAT